jgi:hypothetical protein
MRVHETTQACIAEINGRLLAQAVTDGVPPAKPYVPASPDFDIELVESSRKSRVCMNGSELGGVIDVKVEQSVGNQPIVTISFLARSVNRTRQSPIPNADSTRRSLEAIDVARGRKR